MTSNTGISRSVYHFFHSLYRKPFSPFNIHLEQVDVLNLGTLADLI